MKFSTHRMDMSSKTRLLIGGLLAVIAAVIFVPTTQITNCGGNSAALAQVHEIASLAYVGTLEASDHSFRFTEANSEQREQLTSYARNHWIRSARFLVSASPVFEHKGQFRRVIVVCDTPYRNVPRQSTGSAPQTHAAGFSDGSYGLISTSEFDVLDRSTFKPLDELFPPKSK